MRMAPLHTFAVTKSFTVSHARLSNAIANTPWVRDFKPITGVLVTTERPLEFSERLFLCLFFSKPPTKVSSTSITPFIGALKDSVLNAKRMRCSMNQAVFWVTFSFLASSQDEIPFFQL